MSLFFLVRLFGAAVTAILFLVIERCIDFSTDWTFLFRINPSDYVFQCRYLNRCAGREKFTQRALAVQRHKLLNGPVIGLFDFSCKVASWKFFVSSVISQTFTTSAFQIAWICAWTIFQVGSSVWAFTQFPDYLAVPNLRAFNICVSRALCTEKL